MGLKLGPIGAIIGGAVGAYFGGPSGAIAGASLLGGAGGAMDANEMSQENADKMMGFQERMASTAHQREVADLQAAGLNPILSANAGAPAPSGAQAPVQNVMGGLAASAADAMRLKLEMTKQASEIDLMNAQRKKVETDTKVAEGGIPRSEIVNDLYDIARPAVKRVKEFMQTNPPKTPPSVKDRMDKQFKTYQQNEEAPILGPFFR